MNIIFLLLIILLVFYVLSREGFEAVDCAKFPEAPECRPPPASTPVQTILETCQPADGIWSVSNADRPKLNSPCCQPPEYNLAKGMLTCDSHLNSADPIQKCIQDCCNNALTEANKYDTSWYPMARCACSLWCYNQNIPHFQKYGTAVHYITGDLAEAHARD